MEGPEFGEGELDVVIAPPDVTVVSDEESMDEDNLTGSEAMLPDAAAEIKIHFNPVQSDDMPTTSVPKIKRCMKVKWSKKKASFLSSPVSKEADTLEDLERKLLEKSTNKIFEQCFDDEMLNLLIDPSVLYARQKNRHEFTCTISEMKSFIGLLFTGYHKLSQEKLYWSLDPDCNTAIMRQALSRQRFRDIKINLHLNANSAITKTTRYSKLGRTLSF